MFIAPQQLRFGDEAAEIACRSVIPGGAGDWQHPLGRHSTLGFLDSFGDQCGHRIVVVGPLNPRWCGIAGFELLDDSFDGLVGGAAHLGGGAV